MKKSNLKNLIPIMLVFFCMGFVDMVGIATNYIQKDFKLSDSLANILPSMVFFWFLILSVPTSMLMNRIGQRKTVLLSLLITILSLILPIINYSFISMLISFSLLGIGNTLMQVALNPLLSNVVRGERLASSMTFGQFIKAIASFIAPLIAAWSARFFDNWLYLYPVFMSVAIIAIALLGLTHIEEKGRSKESSSSLTDCFKLLGDRIILLSFLGIICHVGIDVGINVTAPKILMEKAGFDLEKAGYTSSLYFLFRTIGTFLGSFLLTKFSGGKVFAVSVVLMIFSMIGLLFFNAVIPVYIAIALVGLGNANIFPVIVSKALFYKPDKKNEVSGLMIMGLFGGTIFPFVMGVVSDAVHSQVGAVAVAALGVAYLMFLSIKMIKA